MKKNGVCFSLILILVLTGSAFWQVEAGTKVVQKWVAPDVANYQFKHILTICIIKDEEIRRTVEDNLAAQAKKDNAFQSYNILVEADLRDKEQAKRKIQEMGFDGAVVMRPLSVKDRVTYVSGSYPAYYGSFWGYYGYAWPTLYMPDYVYTDKIVQVETMIFSIKDDKLLWTSTTESTNPESARDVVAGVAKAIYKEAKKRGMVK
jgi:hypothetical protein